MALSISGTTTLVLLIVAGPLFYLGRWILQKRRGLPTQAEQTEEHDGRESISTDEYIFALLGYAIGIGNIWRFPYIISNNGGSAAVVAYLICLVLVALPLFLYEMIIGQYTRVSTVPTWMKVRPRWFSFGCAQGLLVAIGQSYYGMIIAYTLPYIAASCLDPLPWSENGAYDYWFNVVLNQYDDVNDRPTVGLGPVQWQLALSLFIIWCMIYFSVAFGKSILAQVTYVTVIMPVVLVIILVGRTVFLDGAKQGIAFYIGKFEASKLLQLDVWAAALSQILFSLSPGFGTAITYSSFTKPKEDVYRVCMIVAVCNSAFSLIGGVAIFAMIGKLALEEGVSVEELAQQGGTGLAFIVIAEAMEVFGSAKNVMSVLFFVMLLTLGLDSAFAWTETVVSVVGDLVEMSGRKRPPEWQTSLVVSVVLFLVGLIFSTRAGNQILDVVDHYVAVVFLIICCFIEAFIFNFDFGWKRMSYALKSATYGNERSPNGRDLFPGFLCRLDFHVTVPLMTVALGIYTISKDFQEPYGGYPASFQAWGWSLLGFLVITTCLTLYKRDPSELPDIEDDEVFKPLQLKGESDKGVESDDIGAPFQKMQDAAQEDGTETKGTMA